MPLWRIYHPEGTFTDVAERKALSNAITQLYVDAGIPAFYVGVVWTQQPKDTMFRGWEVQPSETRPPFVRIVWSNIAGDFEPGKNERKTAFLNNVDAILEPFLKAKGYDYEHHGEDADVTLGRIAGYEFPKRFSPLEKFWLKTNEPKPLPEGWQE